MSQFHFDPSTYLDLMRAEVPAYRRLQEELGAATVGIDAGAVLDLGTGTGETLAWSWSDTPPAAPSDRPERRNAGRRA